MALGEQPLPFRTRTPWRPDAPKNPMFAEKPLRDIKAIVSLVSDRHNVRVRHNNSPLTDMVTFPALEYLQRHGGQERDLSQLFDLETGYFKIDGDPSYNPWTKPVHVLDNDLRQLTAPFCKLGDVALDSRYEYGYNSHDLPHTDFVTNTALALTRTLGFSEMDQRKVVIAARLHDIGNLIDREHHAILAAYFRRHLLPGADSDQKGARQVDRSMNLHDSEPLEKVLEARGLGGSVDIIEFMREFGPVYAALLIADKADVGRHRVSSKPTMSMAVDEDIHMALNLVFATDAVYIDMNRGTLVWNINFNKEFSNEELRNFWPFTRQRKSDGRREALFPAHIVARHDREQEQWQTLFAEQFKEVYGGRMMTLVMASFALSDKIQNAEINLRDKYSPTSEAHHNIDSFVFSEKDLDGQFAYYGFNSKEKSKSGRKLAAG